MKFATRTRKTPAEAGTSGTARVDARVAKLRPRLRPGDIAVLDVQDMDAATAHALVASGVVAVVNAAPMVSGRFANLGPEILLDAGIEVLESIGPEGLAAIKDGQRITLIGDDVRRDERLLASGRSVEREALDAQLAEARSGLVSHLQSFTHNATEFLRREEGLLIHGQGLPDLHTTIAGKPVVVISPAHNAETELRRMKHYLRQHDLVVVAVDGGADIARRVGHLAQVIVLSDDADRQPDAPALRKAADLVLVTGDSPASTPDRFARIGVRPAVLTTAATAQDIALLLAADNDASLVIGVGMNASLDEFLDGGRPGLASTFLTRLRVGPRLVDAKAVPGLYSGAVRPRHLLGVAVAGSAALMAAISVTPVGQDWMTELAPYLTHSIDWTIDSLRGLFS